MKIIKNILLVVGLFLEVSTSFATPNWGHILNVRENQTDPNWVPSGPTREDILSATKVENLAVKGSREDKFIEAVKNGDLKNVETLIASGVDLEARDNENMTALMIAAKKGYTDIVSKLINAGANPAAKGRHDETALFYAYDSDHAEIVKILIAHGAAKNEKNFGELFVSAASRGNNETVKALMVGSASIDDDTLYTAYLIAQVKCSAEIVNAIKDLKQSRS